MNPYGSGFLTGSNNLGNKEKNPNASGSGHNSNKANAEIGMISLSMPSGAGYPRLEFNEKDGNDPLPPESPEQAPSFNYHPLNIDQENLQDNIFSLVGSPAGEESLSPRFSAASNYDASASGTRGSSRGSSSRVPGNQRKNKHQVPKSNKTSNSSISHLQLQPLSASEQNQQSANKEAMLAARSKSRSTSLNDKLGSPNPQDEKSESKNSLQANSAGNAAPGPQLTPVSPVPGKLTVFPPTNLTAQALDSSFEDSKSITTEHTNIYNTPHSLQDASHTLRFTGGGSVPTAPIPSSSSNGGFMGVFPSTPKKAPVNSSPPTAEVIPIAAPMPPVPAAPKTFGAKSPTSNNGTAIQSNPTTGSTGTATENKETIPVAHVSSLPSYHMNSVTSMPSQSAPISVAGPAELSAQSESRLHLGNTSRSQSIPSQSSGETKASGFSSQVAETPLHIIMEEDDEDGKKETVTSPFPSHQEQQKSNPSVSQSSIDVASNDHSVIKGNSGDKSSHLSQAEKSASLPPVLMASEMKSPSEIQRDESDVPATGGASFSKSPQSQISAPFSPSSINDSLFMKNGKLNKTDSRYGTSLQHSPSSSSCLGPLGVPCIPLVKQHDYRKTDIKSIAVTSEYSFDELQKVEFILETIPDKRMLDLEPLDAVKERYSKMSKVKHLKTKNRGKAESAKRRSSHIEDTQREEVVIPFKPPRPVTVDDIGPPIAAYDDIMLAVSFALYQTIMYTNELVEAANNHFGNVRKTQIQVERQRKEEERRQNKEIDFLSSSSYTNVNPPKWKVSAVSLFRWLNELGVDVLVVSSDRQAASSFCAKRTQLRRNGMRFVGDAKFMNESSIAKVEEKESAVLLPLVKSIDEKPPSEHKSEDSDSGLDSTKKADFEKTQKPVKKLSIAAIQSQQDPPSAPSIKRKENEIERAHNSREDKEPRESAGKGDAVEDKRILVVLEYDMRRELWSPVTLQRPINEIAEQLRALKRIERKLREKQRVEAEVKAKEERKLKEKEDQLMSIKKSWMEKNRKADAAWKTQFSANVKEQVVEVEINDVDLKEEAGNKIPFEGFSYPNLIQTDFGFMAVLKKANNPLFPLLRLKMMLGLLLSLAGLAFGIATVVYSGSHLTQCTYNSLEQRCSTETEVQIARNSSSELPGNCPAVLYDATFVAKSLSNRYLFGAPMSAGNSLVVAISCQFVYLIFVLLYVFFVVRFLAVKSSKSCFFWILQVMTILVALVMCAFSAYAVYTLRSIPLVFPCRYLAHEDKVLCETLYDTCVPRGIFFHVFYSSATTRRTDFALSLVFVIICGLELVLSVLPAVPSRDTQKRLRMATPDTIAFVPNYYAPDGLYARQQTAAIQGAIKPLLKRHVKEQIRQKDRVLTHNPTIGQMMQANREQSLRKMQLKTKKDVRRYRMKGRQGHRRNYARPLHYSITDQDWEDDFFNEEEITLSPEMTLKVEEISSALKNRGKTKKHRNTPTRIRDLPSSSMDPMGSVKTNSFIQENPFTQARKSTSLEMVRNSGESEDSLGNLSSSARAEEKRSAGSGSGGGADTAVSFAEFNQVEERKRKKSSTAILKGNDPSSPRGGQSSTFFNRPANNSFVLSPSAVFPRRASGAVGVTPEFQGVDHSPRPKTDLPFRLNPFASAAATSDRIQRKDMKDLEPKIESIVQRLKKQEENKKS